MFVTKITRKPDLIRAAWGYVPALCALLLAAGGPAAMAFQSDEQPAVQRGGRSLAQEAEEGETDRLIIRYRSTENRSGLSRRAEDGIRVAGNRAGVQIGRLRGNASGGHVLKASRRMSLAEARRIAQDLRSGDADIEYVEPDVMLQAQLVPNDPQYASQWHYNDLSAGIRLPQAWDKATGAGVRVAVVDTGVRPHADLAANLLPGYDFIADTVVANDGTARDADPTDPGDWRKAGECGTGTTAVNSSWHGTHVAGTIAAVTNNGVGVAGVAFGAKVVPVRVLGKCGGYTSDIADGIAWAAGGSVPGVPANPYPARVINLSLGGAGSCSVTTQTAINTARSRGAVVVVAAGNSGADASGFTPANCAGVITVAAVARSGGKASYSNFGAVVDVAAPGGDSTGGTVLSTLNSGTSAPRADSYAGYKGTSMAAPHVAGVAALMLSRNAALTPDDVETRIKAAAAGRGFPVSCAQCGAGLLDANAAVDFALSYSGGSTVTAPAPAPVTVVNVAEVEPNNTLGAPQVLSAAAVNISGTIGSSTDTDYYRISIAPGVTLKVSLTPNASSDYDLKAYNSAGTLVSQSALGAGQTDAVSLLNSGTAAIQVVLQVSYYSGATGTAGSYTLRAAP